MMLKFGQSDQFGRHGRKPPGPDPAAAPVHAPVLDADLDLAFDQDIVVDAAVEFCGELVGMAPRVVDIDGRVADASIPCNAQRALDRAVREKKRIPVVKGSHLSPEAVLVTTTILAMRFSFTQVAVTTVLDFVGGVLPDGNLSPCGAMFSRFLRNGLMPHKYDMCARECVVFRDAHLLSDPQRELQLKHATECPCGLPRLVPETNAPAHVRSTLAA